MMNAEIFFIIAAIIAVIFGWFFVMWVFAQAIALTGGAEMEAMVRRANESRTEPEQQK